MSPDSLDIKGMVAEMVSLPPPLTPIKFESRSPLHSISAAALSSAQQQSQQPSASSLPASDTNDDPLKNDLDFSDDSEDSDDDDDCQNATTAQRQNPAPLENNPDSLRDLFGQESDDEDDNDVNPTAAENDAAQGLDALQARPPSAELPRKTPPSKNLFDDHRSSSSSSSSETDSGSEDDDDEVVVAGDEENESSKIAPHSPRGGGSNSLPPSPQRQPPPPVAASPANKQWCLTTLCPSLAQQTPVLAVPEKVEELPVKTDFDAAMELTEEGGLGADGGIDGSDCLLSMETDLKLESNHIPFDGGESDHAQPPFSTFIKSENMMVTNPAAAVPSTMPIKQKDKSRSKPTQVTQPKIPKTETETQNHPTTSLKREPISSEFVPSDSDSSESDSDGDEKANADTDDDISNVKPEKFIPPSFKTAAVKERKHRYVKIEKDSLEVNDKDSKSISHVESALDKTNDSHLTGNSKDGAARHSPVERKPLLIAPAIPPPAFDPDDMDPPMYPPLDGVYYDRKGFPSIIVQWSLFLFDPKPQQQKQQQELPLTLSDSARMDESTYDSETEFIKKVVETPIKSHPRRKPSSSSCSSSSSSDGSSSDEEESDSPVGLNTVDAAPGSHEQPRPTARGATPTLIASPHPPPFIENAVNSASPLAPPSSSAASSELSPLSLVSSNSVTTTTAASIAAEIGGGPNSLPPPNSPYKSQKSSSTLSKPLTPLSGDSPHLAKSPKGSSGSSLKKSIKTEYDKDDVDGCKKPKAQSTSQHDQQHISQLSSSSLSGNKRRRIGDKSSKSSSPSHTFASKNEESRGSRPMSDHESHAASKAYQSLVGGSDFPIPIGSNAEITVMNVEGVETDSFIATHSQPPKRPKMTSNAGVDDVSKTTSETASHPEPPLYSSLTDSAAGGIGGQKCWPPEDSPSAPEVSSSTGNHVDSPPIASLTNIHPPESSVDALACQSNSRTDVGQSSSVTSSAQVSIPVHPFMQQKRLSADEYLKLAKGLKHRADKMADKTKKYMTYIDAVLAFSQCGYEMENEGNRLQEDVYKMYDDTVRMLQHVFGKFKNSDPNDTERKVFVLNLRIQALLLQKLFRFKRADASRHSQILQRELYGRNATVTPRMIGSSPSAASSSPYQANYVAASSSGAPSPATSSHGGAALSPLDATVAIPVRCHSYNQRYKSVMDLVLNSYEMWDQADALANQLKEFFSQVESKCGSIHLSCTILDLARYVKESLKILGHDNSSC